MSYDLTHGERLEVEQARDQAARDAEAHYHPQLVRTAFETAVAGRTSAEELDAFLADLNLGGFIRADQVDIAKVRSRADQFLGVTSTSTGTGRSRSTVADATARRAAARADDRLLKTGGPVAQVMAERANARLHPRSRGGAQ